MTKTYSDLLREARAEIREVTPPEADGCAARPATAVVDVREASEWEQGHIPGAHHVAKSGLEQQIEAAVPDRSTPVVLYCAGGVRSLFAASAPAMGYAGVASMAGGFEAVEDAGPAVECAAAPHREQQRRYSRHLLIPEVGAERARRSSSPRRSLLVGAGGLGSPAALYLAAAGVGTIGIVDFDVVDLSNLQRQVLHTTDRIGEKKVGLGREDDPRPQPGREGRRPRGDARRRRTSSGSSPATT